MAPEGEVARVHQRLVQGFVWYRLPVKWFCDHDEHLRTAEALGELLDELGLPHDAQLCRSATTREVIAAWDRGSKDGRAAYRRALSGSGIEPPDTEALTWGAVMGVEEFDANGHVAVTFERALVDGVLVPGARGWRALQRQLTVAALGEQVPEHPGAQDWWSLVTTTRTVRWIEQRRSPRRRQLIARWETRLLQPTDPPPEVASVVAPLRRLVSATGGDWLNSGGVDPGQRDVDGEVVGQARAEMTDVVLDANELTRWSDKHPGILALLEATRQAGGAAHVPTVCLVGALQARPADASLDQRRSYPRTATSPCSSPPAPHRWPWSTRSSDARRRARAATLVDERLRAGLGTGGKTAADPSVACGCGWSCLNSTRHHHRSRGAAVQIDITAEAAERVRRAGGRVAVDLIQPVGCGKAAEVAIDTHLNGKDLTRYLHATHDDLEVLLAPALARTATSLRLEVTGPRWWRRLGIALDQPLASNDTCAR